MIATLRATVRGGQIYTDQPVDLPDGTELIIPFNIPDEESPEAIAECLAAYDQLEPLEFTDDELIAMARERELRKEWDLADMHTHTLEFMKQWP